MRVDCARHCATEEAKVSKSQSLPCLSSQSREGGTQAFFFFFKSGGVELRILRKHIQPSVEDDISQRYPQQYLPSHIPFLC